MRITTKRLLCLACFIALISCASSATVATIDVGADAVNGVWTPSSCDAIQHGVSLINVSANTRAVIEDCTISVDADDDVDTSAVRLSGLGVNASVELRSCNITTLFNTSSTATDRAAVRVAANASLGDGSRIVIDNTTVSMVERGAGSRASAVLFGPAITAGDDFRLTIAGGSVLHASCSSVCAGLMVAGQASDGAHATSIFGARTVFIVDKSTVIGNANHTSARGITLHSITFGAHSEVTVRDSKITATARIAALGVFVTRPVSFGAHNSITIERSDLIVTAGETSARALVFSRTVSFGGGGSVSVEGSTMRVTAQSEAIAIHLTRTVFGPGSTFTVASSNVSTISNTTAVGLLCRRSVTFEDYGAVSIIRSNITATARSSLAFGVWLHSRTAFGHRVALRLSDSVIASTASTEARGLFVSDSVNFGDHNTVLIAGCEVSAVTTGIDASAIDFSTVIRFGKNATVSIVASNVTASALASAHGVALSDTVTFGDRSMMSIAASNLTTRATGGTVAYSLLLRNSITFGTGGSVKVDRSTLSAATTDTRAVCFAITSSIAFGNESAVSITSSELLATAHTSARAVWFDTNVTFGLRSSVSVTASNATSTAQSTATGLSMQNSVVLGEQSTVSVTDSSIATLVLSGFTARCVEFNRVTFGDRNVVLIRRLNASSVGLILVDGVNAGFVRFGRGSSFLIAESSIRAVAESYSAGVTVENSVSFGDRSAMRVDGSAITATSETQSAVGIIFTSQLTFGFDNTVSISRSNVTSTASGKARGVEFKSTISFGDRSRVSINESTINARARQSLSRAVVFSAGVVFGNYSSVSITQSDVSSIATNFITHGIVFEKRITFADSSLVLFDGVTLRAATLIGNSVYSVLFTGTEGAITFDQNSTFSVKSCNVTAFATGSGGSVGSSAFGFLFQTVEFSDRNSVSITDSTITANVTKTGAYGMLFTQNNTYGQGSTFAVEGSTITATATESHAFGIDFYDGVSFGESSTVTITGSSMTVTSKSHAHCIAFEESAVASLSSPPLFSPNGSLAIVRSQLLSAAASDSTALLLGPPLSFIDISINTSTFQFNGSAATAQNTTGALITGHSATWSNTFLTVADTSFVATDDSMSSSTSSGNSTFVLWPKTIDGIAPLSFYRVTLFDASREQDPGRGETNRHIPPFRITAGGTGPGNLTTLCLQKMRWSDGSDITDVPAAFTVPVHCLPTLTPSIVATPSATPTATVTPALSMSRSQSPTAVASHSASTSVTVNASTSSIGASVTASIGSVATASSMTASLSQRRTVTVSLSLTRLMCSPSITVSTSVTKSDTKETPRTASVTVVVAEPPDEQRPVAVPAEVTQGTATAGVVVVATTSSVVGAVGGGAFALQRVSAMAAFCQPFDPDEPRGVFEHPLRFTAGAGRARHALGSALGALMLAAIAVGVVAAAALVHILYHGKNFTEVTTWRNSAETVRAVPLLAAVFTVAAPMAVDASVEAIVQGSTVAEQAIGWLLVLLPFAVPAVVGLLLWHPVNQQCKFTHRSSVSAVDPFAFLDDPRSGHDRNGSSFPAQIPALWRWLWRASGAWTAGAPANRRRPGRNGVAGVGAIDAEELLVLFGAGLDDEDRSTGGDNIVLPTAPLQADEGPSTFGLYGGLFCAYRAPWHWFLAAEAYAALAIAAVSAASSAPVAWACVVAEAGAVAISVLLLTATIVLRPYLAPGDAGMAIVGSVLEVFAAVLRLAGVGDAVVTGLLLALAAVAIVQLVTSIGRRVWGLVSRKITSPSAPDQTAAELTAAVSNSTPPSTKRGSFNDLFADLLYEPPAAVPMLPPTSADPAPVETAPSASQSHAPVSADFDFEFELDVDLGFEAASDPQSERSFSFGEAPLPDGATIDKSSRPEDPLLLDALVPEEKVKKAQGPTTEDDHVAKRAELERMLARGVLL